MLIIDFHTHCFPDTLAKRAVEALSAKGDIPYLHDGTAGGLDAIERAAGCDGYVLMSISTTAHQTASVNRFAASVQNRARHIYAFGSVHPENADYREQLAAAKALDLCGIKLHPEYQDFHVDDERVFPLYEAIFEQGFPLLFHAGEDLGFHAPWHAEPHQIAAVARRFPQAVIIAAHLGGYQMWREAALHLAPLPNVLVDTSYWAAEMPAEEFQAVFEVWGARRMLFGSDTPWASIGDSIRAIEGLACSDEDKQLIFGGNALRILEGN